MQSLKQQIASLNWQEATPSMQIAIQYKGKWQEDIILGQKYQYYDIASLTKVFFTSPIFYYLASQKQLDFEMPVKHFLDWKLPRELCLKHLLYHKSGYIWWNDYYRKIPIPENIVESRQWDSLEALVANEKIKLDEKCIYSDVDFIVLGFVLRSIYKKELSEIWQEFSHEFSLNLHFNKNNLPKYEVKDYAPTEDCPWRSKVLQGEVHDDNTWAFGGVSTHAGLFASLSDCKSIANLFRRNYLGESIFASKGSFRNFITRKAKRGVGDWAFGFMLPSRPRSSSGDFFSETSIGHTGFTGTSFWYDLEKDLQVIILSHRVHPRRENKAFVNLRPKLHNIIYQWTIKDN